jgi:5-methylcytosine-specific restriction endonuclease McrA
VKFDTQLMENPDISGIEYQQGELAGYEVREYLLSKWGRKCAYCSKTGLPLQIEHIIPRSRGGSDRVSNLTLACKGNGIELSVTIQVKHLMVKKTKQVYSSNCTRGWNVR